MAEEKRYLDYNGLAHLVGKLTEMIEAAGGGGTAQGVYVAYTDSDGVNRICRNSDYQYGTGTVAGALIIEGGRSLLVSSDESLTLPSTDGNEHKGGYDPNNNTRWAMNDFDGKWNTKEITDNGFTSGSYPPGKCHSFSQGTVGEGKWWLPSVGEMAMVGRWRTGLNEVFEKVTDNSYSNIPNGRQFWTSTRNGNYSFWYFSQADASKTGGSADTDISQDERLYVLPVSEWHWIED